MYLKNIFLLNEKHQEEKEPLENRQLEGNISNPLAQCCHLSRRCQNGRRVANI
jgi:hypothetical protein